MAKTQKKKTFKKPIKKKRGNSKKTFLFIGILILGISSWFFIKNFNSKISQTSIIKDIPQGFSSFGIDVSHHQGKIDWETLLNTERFDTIIHFVYCKATEGHTHIDTRWQENRLALNNMGIPNGAYHYFITKEVPKPQVVHFLNHWKKREVDLPPVLDVETEGFSDEDLRAKMTIWLEEVEKASGMRPIIYTSLSFFETKFKDYFPDYKFWIATYSRDPGCIVDKRIIHWQYREDGELPGIQEEIDFNVSTLAF